MERDIKLNQIFSIWAIFRKVFKQANAKLRHKPRFTKVKLGKALNKARDMRFSKMGISTMVSSSKICSTVSDNTNGEAVHISTAVS